MPNNRPGLTKDACAHCHWPKDEHNPIGLRCPDYGFQNLITGWLETSYEERQLVPTESVMTHILADIDQIITEHSLEPTQFTNEQWWAKLRHAVEGKDYER